MSETGYYLLNHPNPHAPERSNGVRFWGYPQRNAQPIRIVVLHDPETIEDFDGPDSAAENVARYFASTDRSASAHACSDADSWVPCLPPEAAAFHVRGYNSDTGSWGIEMGYKSTSWLTDPARTQAIIEQSAEAIVSEVYDKGGVDIPRVLLSKAQVDAGESGYVTHASLDPTRRSDPGKDFPFKALFAAIDKRLTPEVPMFLPISQKHVGQRQSDIGLVAGMMNDAFDLTLPEDGSWGDEMVAAVDEYLPGTDGEYLLAHQYRRLLAAFNRATAGGGGGADEALRAKFNEHKHSEGVTSAPRDADRI